MIQPSGNFFQNSHEVNPISARLTMLYPEELSKVCENCDNILSTHNESLTPYYEYLRQTKGKMIRSIALFESARATGGISDRHITAACALELMHYASLVHDDIIDDAPTRRGNPATHIHFDTHTAVILGDLLLSKGLYLFASLGDADICALVAETMNKIVEGELYQCSRVPVDSGSYLSIIESKTASLFGTAMYLGAYLNASESAISWKTAGTALGMAFQIMDDIADSRKILKKENISSTEQRELFTLPIILYLESLTEDDKKLLLDQLDNPTKQTREMLHINLQKSKCMDQVVSYAKTYLDTASQATHDFAGCSENFFTFFSLLIDSELHL